MPAVELTRLRTQINRLIDRFGDPAGFFTALKDLFDLYANRAYRPGTAVKPQPLLPSYRVSPLITRQLELELGRTCREQPQQALEVIEAVWQDTYLEPRLLAATLLGVIPVDHAESVLEKLRVWGQSEKNNRILDALFLHGTTALRSMAPARLLALYEEWITHPQIEVQSLGLRALVPLVEDNQFENLPPVFSLISPLLQRSPTRLQSDLFNVLAALAQRSPTETAYFLRQLLSISNEPATARLVRRCMPLFPPSQQKYLRAALQSVSGSPNQ